MLLETGKLKPEDVEPEIGYFSFYLEAFSELHTSRQIGMGVGPIPFTAIVEYSRLYDVGDFEEFLYLIRKMDRCYLDLEAKKQKAEMGKSSGGKGNSNKRNSP